MTRKNDAGQRLQAVVGSLTLKNLKKLKAAYLTAFLPTHLFIVLYFCGITLKMDKQSSDNPINKGYSVLSLFSSVKIGI